MNKTLLLRCHNENFDGIMVVPLTQTLRNRTRTLVNLAQTVQISSEDFYCLTFWGGYEVYEDLDLGMEEGKDVMAPEDEWVVIDRGVSPEELAAASSPRTGETPTRTELDQMHVQPNGWVHWSFSPKHCNFTVKTTTVMLLDILQEAGL